MKIFTGSTNPTSPWPTTPQPSESYKVETENSEKDKEDFSIDLEDNNENQGLLSFKNNELIREGLLKHVAFRPSLADDDFMGYEIIEGSSDYSLEDFGLLKGDILVGYGINNPISESNLEEVLLSHVKYGSVIAKVNRNNIEHHIELELDSLIIDW